MHRLLRTLACLAVACAAPTTYDQRQDGILNFAADVQNVVLLVTIPQKISFPADVLDGLFKFKQNGREAQDRADVQVMEAFVEPNTPYRVTIGPEAERAAEGDGRAVEVVIAGRRAGESQEAQESAGADGSQDSAQERNELKLIGAQEQCGPEAERDPVSMTCRLRAAPAGADVDNTPEVVLAST